MKLTTNLQRCVGLLALLFCGCASQLNVKTAPQDSIQQACTTLVMDYAIYRDQANADAWADLFTAQGRLTIGGKTTVGRAALRERIVADQNGPSFTHLMSTVQITIASDIRASGVSYVSVYVGDPGAQAHHQARLAAIGEYRDQFERTSNGWKIAQREFVPRVVPTTP